MTFPLPFIVIIVVLGQILKNLKVINEANPLKESII